MLKWLLKTVFILIALIVVSFILPLASLWLVRDPTGAQVVFWASPWVVAFWALLAYNLVGSKFWRGRGAVEDWRARRGGYLCSVAKSTAWMFAALFFSYGCEFGVLWETHSLEWMAAAAYLPVPFTVAWCARD